MRPATHADLATVAGWIGSEDDCRRWAGPRISWPFTLAELSEEIGFDRYTSLAFCARRENNTTGHRDTDGGDLVAFGQLVRKERHRFHLGRLIVAPDLRGQGFGRRLVMALMDHAVEQGASGISLNVDPANEAAIRLYSALGFVEQSRPHDEPVFPDLTYMERPAFNTFVETSRLLLCPWDTHHAEGLARVLAVNQEHLTGWIPARVSRPGTIPELEARIADWRADFAAGQAFRWAIFEAEGPLLPLGEISLFPRTRDHRTRISEADRLEIGYWLRNDATGKGYATEAIRAIPGVATPWPGLTTLEIRCDPANAPSVAVARRLGFHLAHESPTDMIWQS
ncbi:MAG: GNAT family N-acetyltransferase [Rhodothermales bacterium]